MTKEKFYSHNARGDVVGYLEYQVDESGVRLYMNDDSDNDLLMLVKGDNREELAFFFESAAAAILGEYYKNLGE
jgi:hypothetical protein